MDDNRNSSPNPSIAQATNYLDKLNKRDADHLVRVAWMRTGRGAFLQNGAETGELRPR